MKKTKGYHGRFFKIKIGESTAYLYDISVTSLVRWFIEAVHDPDADEEFLSLLAAAFGGQITVPERYRAGSRKAILEFKLKKSCRK